MREKLFDFLKGIFIGIANVIPGFSGGTMAVILKVYTKIINAFSNFFSHPFKVIKDVWALALGLLIGIVLAIISITKLLEAFPVPTVLFFVGLIIGSIPQIYSSTISYGKLKNKDVIGFVLAIAILVVLPFLNSGIEKDVTVTFGFIMLMFVLGLICSVTMIIPGVSGSLVLMAFGYYVYLMTSIGTLITKVISFDFTEILDLLLVIGSFGIGAVLGIVFISKLIEKLLQKFPQTVYATILGLLVASPFAIIYAVVSEYSEQISLKNPITVVVGIITLAIGTFLAGYIPKVTSKSKKEKDIKATEENHD